LFVRYGREHNSRALYYAKSREAGPPVRNGPSRPQIAPTNLPLGASRGAEVKVTTSKAKFCTLTYEVEFEGEERMMIIPYPPSM
jgi:hypothetical protein